MNQSIVGRVIALAFLFSIGTATVVHAQPPASADPWGFDDEVKVETWGDILRPQALDIALTTGLIGLALFSFARRSKPLKYVTLGLTVAYLGGGSAWMKLPPRLRDMMLGALVLATVGAITSVLLAPVDTDALALASSGRPPANDALGGHAFLWAIALNSFGTLFLVGGSLLSIIRRQRVRVNVWIGGGALTVALATGMSRVGAYDFVYAGELIGIALMFAGFTLAGRPPVKRAQRAAAAPAPAVAAR